MLSEIFEKIDDDAPVEDTIEFIKKENLSNNDIRELILYTMSRGGDRELIRFLFSLNPNATPIYVSTAIANELHISIIRLVFEWCIKYSDYAFKQELMMIIMYSDLESEYIVEFISKLKTETIS